MCVLCGTREKERRCEGDVKLSEVVKMRWVRWMWRPPARKLLHTLRWRAQGRVRRVLFVPLERRKGEWKKTWMRLGGGKDEVGVVNVAAAAALQKAAAAARKCLRRWKWRTEGRVQRVFFVALESKDRRREEGAEVSEVVRVMWVSAARNYYVCADGEQRDAFDVCSLWHSRKGKEARNRRRGRKW